MSAKRPRKSKPALIYREEVSHANGRPGHTRQTFDKARFDAWRRLPRPDDTTIVFSVGKIDWVGAG